MSSKLEESGHEGTSAAPKAPAPKEPAPDPMLEEAGFVFKKQLGKGDFSVA